MCFGHLQSFFIGENIKKLFSLGSEIFWGIWFLDPIDGSDIYGEKQRFSSKSFYFN